MLLPLATGEDRREASGVVGSDVGLLRGLVKDGRPLLTLSGLMLVAFGGFALFLSVRGEFLPHDIRFLGASASELCSLAQCRVAHFMFHDRVAFGGALVAIGVLYMWLAEFPLERGEAWAWWTLVASAIVGFGSFLTYLGYGYLDTWHGMGTLVLLPLFVTGATRSFHALPGPRSPSVLLTGGAWGPWRSAAGLGRLLLLAVAAGMCLAGGTIMVVGMSTVFVPQDLEFIGLSSAQLDVINPRLVPLIAHDRAGFGGGIGSCGVAVLLCVWCGSPMRSLRQALGVAGAAGFGAAIGVHFVIGYTSFVHLLPAYLGCAMYLAGLALCGSGSGTVGARR